MVPPWYLSWHQRKPAFQSNCSLGIGIRILLSLDLGREITGNDPNAGFPEVTQWKTKECRRRCFWSCFVVERLLASGRHNKAAMPGYGNQPRHHLIDTNDIDIQLPSMENDFMFFRPVILLLPEVKPH